MRVPEQGDARRHALSVAAEALAVAGVPVVLGLCIAFQVQQTAVLSLVVVLGCLLAFFAGFEQSRPRLRDTMPIAVLAALAAAGRILFAPIPSFKPVSAIAIIAGAAFGRRAGFLVGALAALVSNFFFGQGPWSPWQMYGWGLVGWLGGVLSASGLFGRPEAEGRQGARGKVALLCYGFLSGPLYGVVLNLWSIVGFYHPETLGQAALVYAAAIPFDVTHGVATAVFLLALYVPWQRKLVRVKRKFGLQA
ncbi:MAG TPA: ECF transporter S component [Candidatus Aphodovivens avistercoris]|nr:ECF transporter S component [Candidatus Aphodovivens avistercoris]